MDAFIARFRRFNRFYTNLLGLLNRGLLGGPLTLAQARVLYEIAQKPGIAASALAQKLAMDRGQLSRLVNHLVKGGLVERDGKPAGRRMVPMYATHEGRKVLHTLERSAQDQAAGLMAGLSSREKHRLGAALTEVENLLGSGQSKKNKLLVRRAASGELGWIISRHAQIYGQEYGFSQVFEQYVLLGMADYLRQENNSRSRVWIAEVGRSPAGSIAIVEQTGNQAQLRWLLVEPRARGLGVGKLLVERALDFSRQQGFGSVMLWTLQNLPAARALYQSYGFELTQEKDGTMGGQPLVEECWQLKLQAF